MILLDIGMPGLDGMEVAKILDRFYRIQVGSSQCPSEFSMPKAVALGISDYLLKPVDTDEMIKLLERLDIQVAEERESREKWNASGPCLKM